MGEIKYAQALRYAVLLCIVESGLVSLALLFAFGLPGSLEAVRLLALFIGAATLIRLLCNAPATAVVLLRAAPWLRRGPPGRVAALNFAVYLGGLATVALAAAAFAGGSIAEAPAGFSAFAGACLISPFLLWPVSPFRRAQSVPRLSG